MGVLKKVLVLACLCHGSGNILIKCRLKMKYVTRYVSNPFKLAILMRDLGPTLSNSVCYANKSLEGCQARHGSLWWKLAFKECGDGSTVSKLHFISLFSFVLLTQPLASQSAHILTTSGDYTVTHATMICHPWSPHQNCVWCFQIFVLWFTCLRDSHRAHSSHGLHLFIDFCACMYVCVWVCAGKCSGSHRPEEGTGSMELELQGLGPPSVGARDQTWALWKISKCP